MHPSGIRGHGVALYLALCVAWAVVVILLVLRQGYPQAAHTLGVPANDYLFGDMRIVTEGIEAAGRGQDVINEDFQPRLYMPIRFPYHRSWLAFGHLGVNGSHAETLAIGFGLALLVHFGVLIAATGNSTLTGLTVAVFACSPPLMLGLERGNADLLLYLLVAAGCHLLTRTALTYQFAAALLVFVAGALKFFPFAAVVALIPGQRQGRWGPLVVLILAAALFLVLERPEVVRIATSPHASSDWASFGSAVSANMLARLFSRVTGIDLPAFMPGLLRLGGILAVSLAALHQARSIIREAAPLDRKGGIASTGFAAGAGIFVVSFVLIRSYNYKFMFLALALPALCDWSRRRDCSGATARLFLATLLLWVWSGLNGYLYLVVNTLVSWVSAASLAALLMVWLLQRIGIQPWPAGPARPVAGSGEQR